MSSPPTIDGFEFVASGATRSGRWPLRDLPRLHSSLVALDGELDYGLQGTRDPMGRRALQLTLRGVLKLSCQRCLETMDFALDVNALLVLATSEAEIEAERAKRAGIQAELAAERTRRERLQARVASTPGELPYDPGRREVTVLIVKMASVIAIRPSVLTIVPGRAHSSFTFSPAISSF